MDVTETSTAATDELVEICSKKGDSKSQGLDAMRNNTLKFFVKTAKFLDKRLLREGWDESDPHHRVS